ncbi:single-stranded DNA-binding protein [Bacteroidetes bacterium endosymbiont of Geopemphigus sp.]|uniref:single-stranded DNA-binding protein n=1 Tax=Bacteroidetes bacterium endosymbiont of Geopemphigus sp. TaxID=2047937 RepID=UPI000CD26B27|nr:single-stranded DNA-binding protein [Bacteroidetes bacterium endosymbiont of Geopemphigus sp.]
MDKTLNRAMLIGEITDEVKTHYINAKQPVARFHLMTVETFYSTDKNKHFVHREWHDIFVRNDLAERCQKRLKKGDKIYLEGSIRNKKWNEQGQVRSFVEIHADRVIQLERKSNNSDTSGSLFSEEKV